MEKRFYEVKEEPPGFGGKTSDKKLTPDEHRAAIAAAAKELNDLRERWLNPPEWTQTRIIEFPGTVGGPCHRYIDPETIVPSTDDAQSSTGLVRYPRLEPRDADCAAKLKKRTLTNLYNERPAWLDLAHKKLDAAVAAAYGWDDLISCSGGLRPPLESGNDGAHRDAATDGIDEIILERLLALNLERAAAEAEAAAEAIPKLKPQRKKADEEML